MLTRAAALVVLTATAPIARPVWSPRSGRAWFWKSLRWFHAAAFTPVLMVAGARHRGARSPLPA